MLVEGTTAVDIGDVPWDDDALEANRAAIRHTCETVLAARRGARRARRRRFDPDPCAAGLRRSWPVTDRADRRPHRLARRGARASAGGCRRPMRRASEMSHVGEMIQVGRRGVGFGAARRSRGCRSARRALLLCARCASRTASSRSSIEVPAGGNVFITVDVDGLDPSLVPGVIAPEPGGLTYFQAIEIIDGVADRATDRRLRRRRVRARTRRQRHRRADHVPIGRARDRAHLPSAGQRRGHCVTDVQRVDSVAHRDPNVDASSPTCSLDRPGPSAPTTSAHRAGGRHREDVGGIGDGCQSPDLEAGGGDFVERLCPIVAQRTIGRCSSSPIETRTLRR